DDRVGQGVVEVPTRRRAGHGDAARHARRSGAGHVIAEPGAGHLVAVVLRLRDAHGACGVRQRPLDDALELLDEPARESFDQHYLTPRVVMSYPRESTQESVSCAYRCKMVI